MLWNCLQWTKPVFLLENKLYYKVETACNIKYPCKERCISFVWHQNFGIPIWHTNIEIFLDISLIVVLTPHFRSLWKYKIYQEFTETVKYYFSWNFRISTCFLTDIVGQSIRTRTMCKKKIYQGHKWKIGQLYFNFVSICSSY